MTEYEVKVKIKNIQSKKTFHIVKCQRNIKNKQNSLMKSTKKFFPLSKIKEIKIKMNKRTYKIKLKDN